MFDFSIPIPDFSEDALKQESIGDINRKYIFCSNCDEVSANICSSILSQDAYFCLNSITNLIELMEMPDKKPLGCLRSNGTPNLLVSLLIHCFDQSLFDPALKLLSILANTDLAEQIGGKSYFNFSMNYISNLLVQKPVSIDNLRLMLRMNIDLISYSTQTRENALESDLIHYYSIFLQMGLDLEIIEQLLCGLRCVCRKPVIYDKYLDQLLPIFVQYVDINMNENFYHALYGLYQISCSSDSYSLKVFTSIDVSIIIELTKSSSVLLIRSAIFLIWSFLRVNNKELSILILNLLSWDIFVTIFNTTNDEETLIKVMEIIEMIHKVNPQLITTAYHSGLISSLCAKLGDSSFALKRRIVLFLTSSLIQSQPTIVQSLCTNEFISYIISTIDINDNEYVFSGLSLLLFAVQSTFFSQIQETMFSSSTQNAIESIETCNEQIQELVLILINKLYGS